MHRLPPFHVPRPRLTERCAHNQVVVVEAAAGYGKTVFGTELVDSWRMVGIEVQVDHSPMPVLLLASRLRAAAKRAGFTEAAAAAAAAGDDAFAAVDALVDTLAQESCAFLIDDAHNASSGAGELIAHLAARLAAQQRLVVLARKLPVGASRLRRAEFLHLSSADLALRRDETLEVCRTFGLDVSTRAAETLERATGGWTAAAVLAAARAARTGETVGSVLDAISTRHLGDALVAILDEALVSLSQADLDLLAQVARLPLLDQEVVGLATGDSSFFERALTAGIPFTPSHGAWWDLPGPVRDYLTTLAPVDAAAAHRAASEYSRRDELGSALQLLLSSGDPDAAAALLAATNPEAAEAMDVAEVRAIFDQLPDEVVDARPNVLLLLAYCLRAADRYEPAFALAERARAIALRTSDRVLGRAASALLLQRHMLALDKVSAEKAAREILASAGPGEELTRARAYHLLGHALGWRLDSSGRRDEQALAEAVECFTRASNLFRSLGMRSMVTRVAILWAMLIEFPRGQATAALNRLDEALPLVADRPRRWAYVMNMRALVAVEAGMDEVCRSGVEEVFRFARLHNDDTMWAAGHWRLAALASYRGDPDGALLHVHEVEAHKGESWWAPASGDFLAEAADLLDRVGHVALAREYLARVKEQPKDAGHLVALSEAAIEARHGDPALAEELLLLAARGRIDPREYWRVTMLRSFAAFRRGEDAIAGALAAQSFEEAARLGQPDLPMVRERNICEQLLGLAAATGQPAAVALKASSLPVSLSVLGRFELTRAGKPVVLGSGQEVRLLKYVAVAEGGAHVEQAIETMWPEAGITPGRHRLSTVLNRLRVAAGDVVTRKRDMLSVAEAVKVDLREFLAEADRAQAMAHRDLALATAIARGAMAGYRGEVLPEDRYEDWADIPRRRAQQVMLDLLDLCAREAAERGDLDGLRRTVERGIELAPYDDTRYLQAVSALLRQGRRGEALSVVHRARSAFAEIGLQPPPELLDLERSIVS